MISGTPILEVNFKTFLHNTARPITNENIFYELCIMHVHIYIFYVLPATYFHILTNDML